MKNIEILAPAGGKEQLEAAVRSGADAVYFGASSFNARRNAENFTDEDFIGAVKYCRERGVKAYITLNTVFKDSEVGEFERTLELIAESKADAVILQDMGAVRTVKRCCPGISMHASTQMAVHNTEGARLLEELGFSRIVLARELSIEEIRRISGSIKAETEVFVHGAHCMSASGMCYMSSILGARSGNRGLCAQPCRLNFRNGKREYALSLKDMCLADMTEELLEAGVTSLKIEGRMKRPEYVAAAVSAYKNAVGKKEYDISLLQSIFSRSGFTKGYAVGKRDLSMFGYRTKEDVVSASSVLSGVAQSYRNENPLVKINMKFILKENEESRLIISDSENTCEVRGAVPEKAMKAPLSEESARRSLLKLGSTFYYCDSCECELDDGLMLRASDINALRRDATERLTEIRADKKAYEFRKYEDTAVSAVGCSEPEIRLMFRSVDLVPENVQADKIILPVRDIAADLSLAEKYGEALCARLPALIYPSQEEKMLLQLRLLRQNSVKYAYCDNIGAVALAKKAGFTVLGGALLNVMNSRAARQYYDMGVEDITLSQEISFSCADSISSKGKTGIICYGLLPLMHFRCCPLQGERGCGDCRGQGSLTDRIGEKFPVYCENRQYSVLYNTLPLYVGDKKLPPVSFITLSFTNESEGDIQKIIYAVKNKKSLPCKKTAGLYERELL